MADFKIDELPRSLDIGRKTEKNVTTFVIDCGPWLEKWPDMEIGVWIVRPDGTCYEGTTVFADDKLTWIITDMDTAISGCGTAEFIGESTTARKLSEPVVINIKN